MCQDPTVLHDAPEKGKVLPTCLVSAPFSRGCWCLGWPLLMLQEEHMALSSQLASSSPRQTLLAWMVSV